MCISSRVIYLYAKRFFFSLLTERSFIFQRKVIKTLFPLSHYYIFFLIGIRSRQLIIWKIKLIKPFVSATVLRLVNLLEPLSVAVCEFRSWPCRRYNSTGIFKLIGKKVIAALCKCMVNVLLWSFDNVPRMVSTTF